MDGGAQWYKYTNNMPAVAVHFIALQKQTNDLVLGTHGRGVIIVDDISPLRELTAENMQKKLHFFNTKPTIIDEEASFSGSFGAETQFVGYNETTAAQIKYHLKKRHTFGKMSMLILDEKGDTISELGPGKSKGINIVNWNYNMKQPKVAKGKTFSFGGFTTPTLPAGEYTVRITKGKDVFEQPLVLAYNPKSIISTSDRKSKKEAVMSMYNMIESLAYDVYCVDAYLTYANENKSKKLISKLDALKGTMVITSGDNYVGAAEPQLREKMTNLFQRVENNPGAPTPNELENLSQIQARYSATRASLSSLEKKYKLGKKTVVKSKEQYLKK